MRALAAEHCAGDPWNGTRPFADLEDTSVCVQRGQHLDNPVLEYLKPFGFLACAALRLFSFFQNRRDALPGRMDGGREPIIELGAELLEGLVEALIEGPSQILNVSDHQHPHLLLNAS
jgi:hypothetical protein